LNASKAFADAREFRANLLTLIAEAMALETLRLRHVEKQRAAALRIAGAR
jgi:hypothetical protein